MLTDISRILVEIQTLIRKKINLLGFFSLIPFIVFYSFWRLIFNNHPFSPVEITGLAAAFCFSAVLGNILSKLLTKKYLIKTVSIKNEVTFLKLISDNTDEILFLLDSLGTITNCNSATTRLLNLEFNKIKEKPVRSVFKLDEVDENNFFKRLILDKLNEVFRLRATELILPIKLPEFNSYKSIHVRLYPLSIENELKNILVVGRLLGNDYITNKWLKDEKSSYIMDNNISHLHIFCYRLTRNLEGKLTYNQIINLQVALLEILINAVEHGNLEIDFDTKTKLKEEHQNYLENLLRNTSDDKIKRKVFINFIHDKDKVTYIIKDEGKGFHWQEQLNADRENIGKNLTRFLHGAGLQIAKNAFDLIKYNEQGNQVTLIKHFNTE